MSNFKSGNVKSNFQMKKCLYFLLPSLSYCTYNTIQNRCTIIVTLAVPSAFMIKCILQYLAGDQQLVTFPANLHEKRRSCELSQVVAPCIEKVVTHLYNLEDKLIDAFQEDAKIRKSDQNSPGRTHPFIIDSGTQEKRIWEDKYPSLLYLKEARGVRSALP